MVVPMGAASFCLNRRLRARRLLDIRGYVKGPDRVQREPVSWHQVKELVRGLCIRQNSI
jgi:hypothetical protein